MVDQDAKAIWWDLRALRATPPGAGVFPTRHRTFCAALEQSEQLFAAAASVGYAARPLPLFYGLSQAGRAIAACLELDESAWQLRGHGVRCVDLHATELWDVRLEPQTSGSFIQLGALVGSPALNDGVRLGDVWGCLPHLGVRLPESAARFRVLRVEPVTLMSTNSFGGNPTPATSNPVASAWLYGLDPSIEFAQTSMAAVDQHLASYPTLDGFEVSRTEDGWPLFHPTAVAGELGVRLQWLADGPLEEHRSARVGRMCLPSTDGSLWVAPKVAGSAAPLHPLMTWWAVLFALSMLARYEPAGWERHRNIDGEASAIAVERLLDRALTEVPELIHLVLAPSLDPGRL